jgi:hypothetical protein
VYGSGVGFADIDFRANVHPDTRHVMADTPADAPRIIQGGMGVGVSNWLLARAVSMAGELGIVSGTVLDSALAALAKRSHGRYAPAGQMVGWYRCPIRLPTVDYRVIEGRCLARIFRGTRRNVVVFVTRWHGRGHDGRRATGPILEHRWRVVEDGEGWVLRVASSGPWPY